MSRLIALALIGTGFVVAVSFSCTSAPTPHSAAALRKVEDKKSAPEKVSVEPQNPEQKTSYAEAIRRRQFQKAAQLIDAASEEDRNSPELRYARAQVALQLGDLNTALREVESLEKKWPLFADEAQEVRLEAAKQSQDLNLLDAFLKNDSSNESKLLIAQAQAKAESGEKARILVDQVLRSLAHSKARNRHELLVQAHSLRARSLIAEGKNQEAAQELHWLATEAPLAITAADDIQVPQPSSPPAASNELASNSASSKSATATTVETSKALDIEAKMRLLDPKRLLSINERISRARAFSDEGWVDECQKELLALRAIGAQPKDADAILAWAIYISRTDYEEAARLFHLASSTDPGNRKKHLYYEAKSLARSNRDREAIGKYDTVAQLGGEYADHARYQAARLRLIDGQWQASVKGLEAYIKAFGRSGRHYSEAQYDLMVAHLAAEDFKSAVTDLDALIKKSNSVRARAQLMELKAVALLGSGQETEAAELFRKVIEERPLSFSALAAAARLAEMKQPVPPWIQPAPPLSNNQATQAPLKLSLPEKAWRLNRVGLDLEAENALRAQESSIRAKYGTRSGEALCRLYGQLERAKRRYQIAQTAAQWSNLKFAPSAVSEWEWDCIYPRPYADIVSYEAALRKVPLPLVYGVMRQESAFRPLVESPAKAVGLMQIIPPTAARIAGELGEDYEADMMRSPATNIRYGSYYLRRLLDMFGGRFELAAAAYNAGPHALTRWLRVGETLPLDIFVARIPYTETRNYVYQVLGNYARYAYQQEDVAVPLLDLKIPPGLKADKDAY